MRGWGGAALTRTWSPAHGRGSLASGWTKNVSRLGGSWTPSRAPLRNGCGDWTVVSDGGGRAIPGVSFKGMFNFHSASEESFSAEP